MFYRNLEREEEQIVQLLNKLIDSFKTTNITDLSSFSNEQIILKLLLEIEPNFNSYSIEMTNDTSFGIRYANFVTLMASIGEYLVKNPDKNRFSNNCDFQGRIQINELLRGDKAQEFLVAEMIIFLTSVTSRVDEYVDCLEKLEETNVNTYFSICEKYISHDKTEEYSPNKFPNEDVRSSMSQKLSNANKINELERLNNELKARVDNLTKEIQNKNEKLIRMDKNYQELEQKYKDALYEIESCKKLSTSNRKVEEQLLDESILINQLKSKISQKELEIEDIKKDKDLQIKSLTYEYTKIKDKLEMTEDKMSNLSAVTSENEKLKMKIKELNAYKEKQNEVEELSLIIASKQRMIDNLIREKQADAAQMDKLQKEIYDWKEKVRQAETERFKLEKELVEITIKRDEIRRTTRKSKPSTSSIAEISNISKGSFVVNLDQIENEESLYESNKEKEELIHTIKLQTEKINAITMEKEKLLIQMESLNNDIKRANVEKDKVSLEKEKVMLKLQKCQLDIQKLEMNYTMQKKKIEDELKESQDTVKKLHCERNSYARNPDAMNKEERVFELSRDSRMERISRKLETRSELDTQRLQKKLEEKEEIILKTEQKLNILNEENQGLVVKIKELEEKYRNDFAKFEEDLSYYRSSYDEQKERIDREHELISSSLYELALQFMNLNGELNKRNQNNVNKSWLEMERSKNFPTEKF